MEPVLLDAGAYYIQFTGTFAPKKWNGKFYVIDKASPLSYDGTISVQAIPEASTWVMMTLGLVGLGAAGRFNASRKPISIFG